MSLSSDHRPSIATPDCPRQNCYSTICRTTPDAMPLPLELPTIQNWSCHNCGGCCRQHAIAITVEEHQRIAGQGWTAADGIPAGQPLFERLGWFPWSKWHRLAHQPYGACVFLDERGMCRIHAKFGEAA